MSNNLRTPRQIYRDRLAARRTKTYLILFALLGVMFITGLLTTFGFLPSPYNPPFKHKPIKPTYYTSPCVPTPNPGMLPTEQISVSVLNATNRSGLAASTADSLKALGVQVTRVGNSRTGFDEPAQIRTSIHGLTEAYSLANLIPGAVVSLEPTNPKAPKALVLLLGDNFEKVISKAEFDELKPALQLQSPANCEPIDPLYIEKEVVDLGLEVAPSAEGAGGKPAGTAEGTPQEPTSPEKK